MNKPAALSDTRIKNTKPADKPIKLTDGGGLFLLITPNGSRLWRYRYRLNGKENLFALGEYRNANNGETPEAKALRVAGGILTLAEAREAQAKARALVKAGQHPSAARTEARRLAGVARETTFEGVSREWLARVVGKWKPETYRQRERLLEADIHSVATSNTSNTAEAPKQKTRRRIGKLSAPLNAEKPAMQNQSADQVKFDEAELVVEHHESVPHPVQVNVAYPGATLAGSATEDTTAAEVEGADSSPSTASGDAVPLSESSLQAGATTQQSVDEIVLELASLEPLEYDKKRQEMADALGSRLSTLDAAVKAARDDQSEAVSSPFPDVEPHPEPIDPAELLNEVADNLGKYIVLDEPQKTAAALWAVSTWMGDVLDYAPLAIISAPEKSCGKTQLLAVLGHMSCRPMHTSNSSVSSLFRSVEHWKPTVLIDEADTFFRANKELHGMVNAGYHRSGVVIRSESVNGRIVPRSFSVYSPKALAGIDLKKHLPDATMSRGIVINLRRKLPHESVSRLRHADSSSFAGIAAKLARFAEDYSAQVRQAKPALSYCKDRSSAWCQEQTLEGIFQL
jgi:Arm DNA-binding domain/Protein of unknown function (DUF3631)